MRFGSPGSTMDKTTPGAPGAPYSPVQEVQSRQGNMSFAFVHSRTLSGIRALPVGVEVHLSRGLPKIMIVGLPETAVKESRQRVRSALLANAFAFPARVVTINLAPADVPKHGGCYDLPMAVALLMASGQLPAREAGACEFIGELSLDGKLRPVRGGLPIAMAAAAAGRKLILPRENLAEAALSRKAALYPAEHLKQVVAHLLGTCPLARHEAPRPPAPARNSRDLGEVQGQAHAKRALTVAAAGRHNMLMVGPPGSGKTMLAERLPGILPELSEAEALETAVIYSISRHRLPLAQWRHRPFRNPHHSSSGAALVGGGSYPRPGEISLAHQGVLFLDELPEFSRRVLEVLREPLESGRITLARAAQQVEYPARFQFIAAMNPCPCGHLGDKTDRCQCTEEQIRRYRLRISGPILDRIDIIVDMPNVASEVLNQHGAGQAGGVENPGIREKITAAIARQQQRRGKLNSMLGVEELQQNAVFAKPALELLRIAADKLQLSARSLHRIMKVACTIADLEGTENPREQHVAEAINFRRGW